MQKFMKSFKLFYFLWVLLGLSCSSIEKPPEADFRIHHGPVGSSFHPISMQLINGVHPVISIKIKDKQLNLLVDTGASHTFLPASLFPGESRPRVDFCLPNGLCVQRMPVQVSQGTYTDPRPGYYNGLLGMDLLASLYLTIDYANEQLYIGRIPFLQHRTTEQKIIPLKYPKGDRRPHAAFTLNDSPEQMILLDTGGSITRISLKDAALVTSKPLFHRVSSQFNRTEKTTVYTGHMLCLEDACLTTSEVEPARWAAIGGTYFRHFLTAFHFPDQQLLLKSYVEPPVYPARLIEFYGLQLNPADASQLLQLTENGLAWQAGLRLSDRILSINGLSIHSLGYFGSMQQWSASEFAKGSHISLRILREEKELELTIRAFPE